MEDFKDLKVWVKAHELTLGVYKKTRLFPKEELFGITSQMRRASVSVEANIAEGCGRRSDGEMKRFLQIARGSASEVECHLILSRDLELMSVSEFKDLEAKVLEIQRMLAGFVQQIVSVAPGKKLEASS
jgi:four helix bundle protein